MTHQRSTDRPARRLLVAMIAGAALLVLAPAPSAVAAEPPDTTGAVRLAHLAPDIAGVDVTLTSFKSTRTVSFDDVGYGEVSDYRAVAPGFYNATLAPAGDPGAAPVLTASLEITPGAAATVAVSGTGADHAADVLTDDLTPPPPGRARVRLLQGASGAASVDVAAVDGPVIAQDVAFGDATGYADVPAGTWRIRITPSGASTQPVTTDVTLRAGSVQTLLLLDDGAGVGARTVPDSTTDATPAPGGRGTGVIARVVADGQGMPQVPTGGVQTGAGSTASVADGSRWTGTVLALLLAGFAGSAVTAGLRRPVRASGTTGSAHRGL